MAQLWSFIAASAAVATGKNPTPAIPTGRAAGDLLILVASSAAVFSATPPAGFTQIVRNTTASPFLAVWWKVASGSEAAPAVSNSNTTSKATLLCYRKATVMDGTGTLTVGSTTATTTTAVSNAGTDDLVLNLYGGGITSSGTGSWSGGSTNSRVSSGTSTTLGGLYCTDENQAASGSTTARTGTLSAASTGTQGVTISFLQNVEATTAGTDGPDIAAAVAATWTTAQVAAVDGADVAAVGGQVTTGGTVSTTDGPDTAAAVAATWTTAQVAAVDGADVAAVGGQVTTGGSVSATDAVDTAAAVAATWTTAQVETTDAGDAASVDVSVTTGADVALNDGGDIAAADAASWATAQIDAMERGDVFAISGGSTFVASRMLLTM